MCNYFYLHVSLFLLRDVGRRMYEIALRGQVPDPNELLSKNDLIRIKRCIYAQGAGSLPPITTHNIVDDNLDPIMNAFRRCQLFNNHHDRVKVRMNNQWCQLFFLQNLTFSGYFSPRVSQFNKSLVWIRLPRFCTWMSFRSFSQLLRALGIHSCWMYHHGHPQYNNQFVWFWMFHEGSDQRSPILWNLYCR